MRIARKLLFSIAVLLLGGATTKLAAQSHEQQFCDLQSSALCVTLTAPPTVSSPYSLSFSSAAPYNTISFGGILIDINGIITGTSNIIGDANGNVTMSGTGSVLQITGTTGGIDVTADTSGASIQTVGGVLGVMFKGDGYYIDQTGSTFGSNGGYLDWSILSYPPVSSGGCTDIWSNNTTLPVVTPQQPGGVFNPNDTVSWNGPSPLYGASPSNCGPSPFIQFGGGTVNTSGTSVTLVSGSTFNTAWTNGGEMLIGGLIYTIATVNSSTSITLTSSAGTNTGATYSAGFLQNANGLNFNSYIGSLTGIASFSSAYDSIQSLSGGLSVGTSLLSGQPWIMQGYAASSGFVSVPATYPAAGSDGNYISAATYTGNVGTVTVTGPIGSYCAVGPFSGGGYGAAGIAVLTTANTISGATITMVNHSSGVIQGGIFYTSGGAGQTAILNNGSQVVWYGHVPAQCTGTINVTTTLLPVYWGGLSYQGGSVYYYYNSTTATWNTVDFSGLTGGYFILSGSTLYPSNTTYNLIVGESTNLSGAKLEVAGAVTTQGSNTPFTSSSTGSNEAFETASLSFQVLGNGFIQTTNSFNTTAGGYQVGGVTSINSSNQFVGAAVNVTGVVESQVTGASDAFLLSDLDFVVLGNGFVQTTNSFNTTVGSYEVNGSTAINSSNQFVGAAVNVAGVVESQVTGGSDAFLLSDLDFVVLGNGFVQTTNSFNTTSGTYEVNGSTAINSSNQFVGAAVNVTGVVESQITSSADAFLLSNLDFVVTGQGFVQTTNYFNATSSGGYELNGTIFLNSSGMTVPGNFYGYYNSGNSSGVSCSGVANGWQGIFLGSGDVPPGPYFVACMNSGTRYRALLVAY